MLICLQFVACIKFSKKINRWIKSTELTSESRASTLATIYSVIADKLEWCGTCSLAPQWTQLSGATRADRALFKKCLFDLYLHCSFRRATQIKWLAFDGRNAILKKKKTAQNSWVQKDMPCWVQVLLLLNQSGSCDNSSTSHLMDRSKRSSSMWLLWKA